MPKVMQLSLFSGQNLNIVTDVKRQIRMAIARFGDSRDILADRMNELAARDGIPRAVTKAKIEGWCKDSEPGRLPSLVDLALLCQTCDTVEPLRALALPLGADVIGPEEKKVLSYGQAEIAKKRATRKARLALEILEV